METMMFGFDNVAFAVFVYIAGMAWAYSETGNAIESIAWFMLAAKKVEKATYMFTKKLFK